MRRKKIETPIEENIKEVLPEPQPINISEFVNVNKRPKLGTLKIGSSKDVLFWTLQSLRATADKYTKKSFLEKYGTLLSVIFIGLVVSFSVVYMTNKLVEMVKIMRDGIHEISVANERVSSSLGTILKGSGGGIQPILGKEIPIGQ